MERYVVLDLETTGHSPRQGDKIIQIGAVVIEGGQIVERFASYVQPGKEIPPFITELTGITDELVQQAPTFNELIPLIIPMFESADLVAHNVLFDYSFLKEALQEHGYAFSPSNQFDTVELARILLPSEESYKLGHLAERLGFDHDRPHQADSDAEVTGQLFLFLMNKLHHLPTSTLKHLQVITTSFRSDLPAYIDKLLLTDRFEIDRQYDHFRSLSLALIEEEEPLPVKPNHSFQEVIQSLKADVHTETTKAFKQYEKRDGQIKMMEAVANAFANNEHMLLEAGTGTGKSIAYLLPSALYSMEKEEPIVVSTQTIPLQEQIFVKDLPILSTLLAQPVRAALLKGRNHYLCLRRFEQSLNHTAEDTYDIQLTKAQLLVWITETKTGDVEELSLTTGGRQFWFDVRSEAKAELGSHNSWANRCFYYRARKKAQNAHIIVTNHALLFTDLMSVQSLIPKYERVIIDEAHHFEEAASNHLGAATDYLSFMYVFQRLHKQKEEGLLEQLKGLLERYQLLEVERFLNVQQQLSLMNDEVDELFRMIFRYVEKNRAAGKSDTGRLRYRFLSYEEKGVLWDSILESAMRFYMQSKRLFDGYDRFYTYLNDESVELQNFEKAQLVDIHSLFEQLREHVAVLYEMLLECDPDYVYWIEIEARGAKNAAYLFRKPIDVAELLADSFFTKKKSAVLTSATLTVQNSFQYQIDRLGLADFGVKALSIATPFNYEKQALLLLPTDLPAIKEVSEKDFAMEVSIKVIRIIQETDGKMLILFTSFEMLRSVYQFVKDLKSNDDNTVLIGQGVTSGSRSKLLKLFKQSEKAVLFGTSSFWEGIDMPGAELEQLIIVRLPFSPPDDPQLQAQFELAKERGLNPFTTISLPQAIIRFKQGFGRLIRTNQDRGCIYIFDRRISTTQYGKAFVHSLPEMPIAKGKLEALLKDVQTFQNGGG
ncbi:ATP-dependent DNA helicase DinG [Alkalihalobacillus pseudalcaliphilus]|uniref:ATP-dependent DNA helicase DinG n=1 Tax=Alkalihalobacillus pseudalcaliphilus TaxID=79884 RepID=UPI00064E03EF|nr:ATP-dependent DNA helicase DinG [Alkalihalobacillus pseudalcaliphilus]KMK76408.1 DNA polymerase III subunit epsilon [Alkalihalobacillus pseudalcaliphilus]